MRVSCACPVETATPDLVDRIQNLGLQPIVTSIIIRAVYEGPDHALGKRVVELFSNEIGHTITIGDYEPPPKPKSPKPKKQKRGKTRQRGRR